MICVRVILRIMHFLATRLSKEAIELTSLSVVAVWQMGGG